MTRRVIVDGSGTFGSPLLISVAGVDAASAEFNDLIFDGNQSPLRLWATGYLTIGGITYNDFIGGKNINTGVTGAAFGTPSGTFPVFMTMWRQSTDPSARVWTPSFQAAANNGNQGGGGGGICSGVFKGFNSGHGLVTGPTTPAPDNYVNYCVFRNTN